MIFDLKILGPLVAIMLSGQAFSAVQLKQLNQAAISLAWKSKAPEIRPAQAPKISGAPSLDRLFVEGLSLSQTPFHPSLPYKSFIVKGKAESLKISIREKKIGLLKEVTPAPAPKWPCRCDDQAPEWSFNKLSYQHPRVRSWVQVSSLGDYKGAPLSRVTFYPAKLKDVRTVEFLKSARIEIQGAQLWKFPHSLERSNTAKRFLIISPEKFRSPMQKFAKAKIEAGFDVLWIDYQNQGAKNLEQEIQNLYSQKPIDFAVIAGAHSEVPGRKVFTSADPETLTDRKYFSMGGSGDYIPDVFYSRLVAKDSKGMSKLVNKVLESNNSNPGALKNEAMGLASDEGLNPSDEEYIHKMIGPLENKLGWRAQYYLQRRRRDNPDSVIQGFARGSHWLNYIGHGVGPAWTSVSGREFNLEDVKKIPAHEALPVVIDVACQNGSLGHDDRLGVHLMNHFEGEFPAGSKAYYGGNVDISWHPPAVMAVGIGQARASGEFQHLGEVLWAGQVHLLRTYEDLPAALENLSWYHLQGDPALRMPQ